MEPALLQKPGRLEAGLLLGFLLFYALGLPINALLLRPGFVIADEQGMVDAVQWWRETGQMVWREGNAAPLRLVIGWLTRWGGPSLVWFHLPSILAVLAEPLLLFLWVRPHFGERAALWAALADLASTVTFARGRAILSPSPCPALLLGLALWADQNRRAWQAALWGLLAACGLFLYEGWALALAGLVPYAAHTWRLRPRWWAAAGLGLLAGAALVALSLHDWAAFATTRAAHDLAGGGPWPRLKANLHGLLWPGQHRLPFSAAPGLPIPSPWTWPLLLAGLWQGLRRWPALGWLVVGAAPGLFIYGTWEEPHRLFPLWLALAALTGWGAQRLIGRRWGLAACVALLLGGAAVEAHAWMGESFATVDLNYGYSHNLAECARYLAAEAPPQGWDVIDGLGFYPDQSFHFFMDEAGVPRRRGGVPVALVPWDDRPALNGRPGRIQPVSTGGIRPLYLYFPSPAELPELRAIQATLAPLHREHILDGRPPTERALALAILKDPACRDPWARSVLWETWLDDSRAAGLWDPAQARAALAEPLINGRCDDIAADILSAGDPADAAVLRARALQVDPRRAALPALMRPETF